MWNSKRTRLECHWNRDDVRQWAAGIMPHRSQMLQAIEAAPSVLSWNFTFHCRVSQKHQPTDTKFFIVEKISSFSDDKVKITWVACVLKLIRYNFNRNWIASARLRSPSVCLFSRLCVAINSSTRSCLGMSLSSSSRRQSSPGRHRDKSR